ATAPRRNSRKLQHLRVAHATGRTAMSQQRTTLAGMVLRTACFTQRTTFTGGRRRGMLSLAVSIWFN
ncbi:hypothetical protein PROFUN_17107, partial [Planoprotostelium fungivorum]